MQRDDRRLTGDGTQKRTWKILRNFSGSLISSTSSACLSPYIGRTVAATAAVRRTGTRWRRGEWRPGCITSESPGTISVTVEYPVQAHPVTSAIYVVLLSVLMVLYYILLLQTSWHTNSKYMIFSWQAYSAGLISRKVLNKMVLKSGYPTTAVPCVLSNHLEWRSQANLR